MLSTDVVIPLTDTDTLPSTLALFSMDEENAGEEILHLDDEVLQATLARTVRSRHGDTSAGKCRVSGASDPSGGGVGKCSGKAKVKNRARKEVT